MIPTGRRPIPTRHRGQAGASLLLVLGLIAFVSVVLPALLGMTVTGLRVTSPIVRDRAEVYAATSAIEGTIAMGRGDPTFGLAGGPCPGQVLAIGGFDVHVDCIAYPPPTDACERDDRFVVLTATVRQPDSADVLLTSSAEIAYRPRGGTLPAVEVRQFSSNVKGPVTLLPASGCNGVIAPPTATTTIPPTTTTTVPTTSTTTTMVPTTSTTTTTTTTPRTTTTTTPVRARGYYTEWGEPVVSRTTRTWTFTVTVRVTDETGAPVPNTQVMVTRTFRFKNYQGVEGWRNDGADTPNTNANGIATFSRTFGITGNEDALTVKNTIDWARNYNQPWDQPKREWINNSPQDSTITIDRR